MSPLRPPSPPDSPACALARSPITLGHDAYLLGYSAIRHPHTRQLSRRTPQLGGAAGGHECIYCVVDLHAITVWQDPAALTQQTREMAASFSPAASIHGGICCSCSPGPRARATGLDLQLHGPHRLAQPHDAVQGQGRQGPGERVRRALRLSQPHGRRYHAYHATRVPVGDDQRQHLELANDIAQKFNHDYNVDFSRNRAADPRPSRPGHEPA